MRGRDPARRVSVITRGKRMNLVIVPEKRNPANPPRHYRFEARLEGDDHILCVSHQPFVDAARVLVAEGYDPTETLTMRHVGSTTIALTATLGAAAKLKVEEGANGGPRFVQHVPWSSEPALKQAAACRTYGATRRSRSRATPPSGGRVVKKRQTVKH